MGAEVVLLMATEKALREMTGNDEAVDWLDQAEVKTAFPEIRLSAPVRLALRAGGALKALRDRLAAWRASDYRLTASDRWTWRPPTLPKRHEYYARLCSFFEVSGIMPRVAVAEPDVGPARDAGLAQAFALDPAGGDQAVDRRTEPGQLERGPFVARHRLLGLRPACLHHERSELPRGRTAQGEPWPQLGRRK